MDSWNLLGLIISVSYIAFILLCGYCLQKIRFCDVFFIRKFVHMGLANWWLIRYLFFNNYPYIILLPLSFVFINFIIAKSPKMEFMQAKDGYGTCYYALSLAMLVSLSFLSKNNYIATTITFLSLGYSDALAAIIGKKYGIKKTISNPRKTYIGSLTFAIVTTIIYIYTFYYFSIPISIIYTLGFVLSITFVELTCKSGIDNLMIPIISYILIFSQLSTIFLPFNMILYIMLNFFIAFLSYRKKVLTIDGAIATFFVGEYIVILGSGYSYLILLLFYTISISSEFIIKMSTKGSIPHNNHKARNWNQVICNSFIGCLSLFLFKLYNENIYLYVYVGTMAGCLADTLASSYGKAFGIDPIYILSKKKIQKGLSGGVSAIGTLAGLIGSYLITLVGVLHMMLTKSSIKEIIGFAICCAFGGCMGMIIDSILGECIQVKYKCLVCQNISEHKICHNADGFVFKGFKRINNNTVNLLASLITAILIYSGFRILL